MLLKSLNVSLVNCPRYDEFDTDCDPNLERLISRQLRLTLLEMCHFYRTGITVTPCHMYNVHMIQGFTGVEWI